MYVFLSFAHSQGDYDVIDAETNMSVLFTLLRDWVRSVKGGFIPPERRNEFLLLVEREEDEKLYQKVLELPLAVSSTILYVVRFIWQLMLFPKSVNRNPDSSVCFYSSLYPTSIVADALGNSSQLGAMIIVLLRAVAVHEREPFLPPDPVESEIDQFKVLLFSHIAPSPSKNLPYEYTLSALRTLEQTAENMFQYGLLPPTNCFGCSPHRLPRSPSAPIRLFDPSTSYFLKTPETKVYSVGHMWFSPFLDGIHVVLDGGWECTIPMSDIQVLFPFSLAESQQITVQLPCNLLEYERRSLQSRCLSLVTPLISRSVDVVLQSPERRDALLNILDLYLEWSRSEASSVHARHPALSASERVPFYLLSSDCR